MNAGPPLMSPSAKSPAASVSSLSLSLMKPRSSVLTPAAARLSVSELGTRPVATSKCVPWRLCDDFPRARTVSEILSQPIGRASRFRVQQNVDAVLFQDRGNCIRDVRVLAPSNCSPHCTIVTRLPKRRNNWPNSSPTYPPPSTRRCFGTSASSMIERAVQKRNVAPVHRAQARRAGIPR